MIKEKNRTRCDEYDSRINLHAMKGNEINYLLTKERREKRNCFCGKEREWLVR
jgi:hypothetical protein